MTFSSTRCSTGVLNTYKLYTEDRLPTFSLFIIVIYSTLTYLDFFRFTYTTSVLLALPLAGCSALR